MKPMTSPLRRINRAKKHLNVLNREIKGFIAGKPYRYIIKKDPKDGLDIFYPYLVKQLPLVWGFLIGEVVHGLRSALDNIAWSLAVQQDEITCFPIFLKESNQFTVRLKRLREDIRADVEALQPYNRTDGKKRTHPLWILQRMDIIDKHRTILPGLSKLYLPTGLRSPKWFYMDGITRLNKGDVEFKLHPPLNLKKDFNPEIAGQVVFDISSTPKDPTDPDRIFLNDLFIIHNFIRNDVYPRFAKFLEPENRVG
jgi:hypothetical protein